MQQAPVGYRDFANSSLGLVASNPIDGNLSALLLASSSFQGSNMMNNDNGRANLVFPQKLHLLLTASEQDEELARIVSWRSHGRAFIVHDRDKFVAHVLPEWFLQSRFESFQRQLNLYGFIRITSGPDRGACYHELFLRQRPFHACQIQRIRLKGKGPRKPAKPELEPNFYRMPVLPTYQTSMLHHPHGQRLMNGCAAAAAAADGTGGGISAKGKADATGGTGSNPRLPVLAPKPPPTATEAAAATMTADHQYRHHNNNCLASLVMAGGVPSHVPFSSFSSATSNNNTMNSSIPSNSNVNAFPSTVSEPPSPMPSAFAMPMMAMGGMPFSMSTGRNMSPVVVGTGGSGDPAIGGQAFLLPGQQPLVTPFLGGAAAPQVSSTTTMAEPSSMKMKEPEVMARKNVPRSVSEATLEEDSANVDSLLPTTSSSHDFHLPPQIAAVSKQQGASFPPTNNNSTCSAPKSFTDDSMTDRVLALLPPHHQQHKIVASVPGDDDGDDEDFARILSELAANGGLPNNVLNP